MFYKTRDTKDSQLPPEAKRKAWKRLSLRVSEGTNSEDTSVLDFQSSVCERIHFWYFMSLSVRHFSMIVLGNEYI